MENLKKAICTQAQVFNNEIIKVDSFLNHQVDPHLMKQMGECFYKHFKDKKITKVVTVESSGISPALMCALYFDVPMIFIKKANPSTMVNPLATTVHSFTKNKTYTLCIEQGYLDENDHILFIDDFLANAEAFKGVEVLLAQSGATISGVGIVITKAFQKGKQYILDKGYDLYSLASIKNIRNNEIFFEE